MKIKAFTLAEAIVMIGILGVITAVAIPTIVKKDFKTDTSIRAASKAYGALAQAVANIVQDGYYYKNFDRAGLADTTTGVDVLTGKQYTGTAPKKFINILADTFYVSNSSHSTSGTSYVQFDTPDGIRWKLVWNTSTFNSLTAPMRVFVDTNVKNGTDFECRNLSQCKVIDTVVFLVHRNGNVIIDGIDTNPAICVNSSSILTTSCGTASRYNDPTFIKKIMGQYEGTTVQTSHYN